MNTDDQPQQVLRVFWTADGNEEGHEGCTVPIARLRQHCSSEIARSLRQKFGSSAEVANAHTKPVLWGADLFSALPGNNPSYFEYKALMEDDQQSSSVTAQLMGRLKSHGIVVVRGVPTDLPGTEALGLKFAGHLMSTLYGKNSWSISKETVESDTLYRNLAYTTDYLALHTDCVFLSEPPGLQVIHKWASGLDTRTPHNISLKQQKIYTLIGPAFKCGTRLSAPFEQKGREGARRGGRNTFENHA